MTGRRSHGRLSALNGVVHQGSLPQLQIDHPGPVATVAVSEGDNAPPECQVSVRRRLIPQRRRTQIALPLM